MQPGWDSDAARVLTVTGGMLTDDDGRRESLRQPAGALPRRDETLRALRSLTDQVAVGVKERKYLLTWFEAALECGGR